LQKGIQANAAFSYDSQVNDMVISLDNNSVTDIYYFIPRGFESLKKATFSDLSDEPGNGCIVDFFPKDPFNWEQ
jgi:hypothetical protein